MTVNEIVDELRATRPRASDALRLQVMTLASQPAPHAPTLLARLRDRRRLALLVPATAALAVASAVAIGVTRSGAPDELGATAPEARGSADSLGEALTGPATAVPDASAAQKAAPTPVTGRAQRYSATLALRVDDNEALSDATQRALGIARDLGGYVVSVRYATGTEGTASLTLRVPSASAGDAVTRLSSLGTIVAQDVQIDDLQASLDSFDTQLRRIQARIAALTAAIARAGTAADRARLEESRAGARAELRALRASRSATAAEARSATIQLELRTQEQSEVVAPGSRLDRALDKALAVLAWEAVVVLAIAVVLAPFALVAAAVWTTRRARRRREEERLLAAS
jgi:hypothetical protein